MAAWCEVCETLVRAHTHTHRYKTLNVLKQLPAYVERVVCILSSSFIFFLATVP